MVVCKMGKSEVTDVDGSNMASKKNSGTEVFRRQILKKLIDNYCTDDIPEIKQKLQVSKTCQDVWIKFSKTHQKSPSHKNNNVKNCTKFNETMSTNLVEVEKEHLLIVKEERLGKSWLVALTQTLHGVVEVLKFWFYSLILFSCIYSMVMFHKPTQAFISRNTQDLIYPVMRYLRLLSYSYVKDNPSVTKLYEDSCLIPNPYFTVIELDCWPCEASRSIIDLTGFSNFSSSYHDSGIPFVVKDAVRSDIGIEDIKKISLEDDVLLTDLFLSSGLNDISKFKSEFDLNPSIVLSKETLHVTWKINRAKTVRMLRKYFSKPYFVPSSAEVSVQHFLFIDHSLSPTYTLPLTEFANVFLTQASGSRFIVLIPTEGCRKQCKILSIILKPKDVLFYNWLFWIPKSGPVDSSASNLSVTYIGSFY